jgi:hypothetical protein
MMAKGNSEELEGITLTVYLQVIKKGKPVGPRDIMKAANLSSPSVAYRHLQKLEDLGYLQKKEYGEYIAKKKAHIRGYVWIGKRLMPALWRYSIVFLVILAFELYVLAAHFSYETNEFKVFFLIILAITGVAFAAFTIEGFMQTRHKPSQTE